MALGSSASPHGLLRIAIVLVSTTSLGCFAISRGESDFEKAPVVNTGVGAMIIRPNQNPPTYYPPGTQAPPSAQPQGAAPSYGSAPTVTTGPNGEQRTGGAAVPNQVPIQMIGGAEQDISGQKSWKQEPAWLKYLALPFAIVAAPFKAMTKEPENGPEIPKAQPLPLGAEAPRAAPPPPPKADYETAMVDQLERELDARNSANAGTAESAPTRNQQPRSLEPTGSPGSSSIAQELEALQRAPRRAPSPNYTPPTERQSAPNPSTPSAPPSPQSGASQPAEANGIVDRDGDGRVDQWIFRERGEISRVELDENADGRPDRSIHYDLDSHQIARVEEDTNADGASDSWTEYRDGQVSRRRGDGDYDGSVDTWTFYRAGTITRHERDTTGNGFRDRVGHYTNGKITREEKDLDGDGQTDSTLYYDSLERISRREEDKDHDGRPDVISHYEAGKLSRKELIQNPSPPETASP
jgi:hypothetical protein